MQEKTVYRDDFCFFFSFGFAWRQVQFQISSLKVTACLLTRGLKKKSHLQPFLKNLYRERLLSMKGKFKIRPGRGTGDGVRVSLLDLALYLQLPKLMTQFSSLFSPPHFCRKTFLI